MDRNNHVFPVLKHRYFEIEKASAINEVALQIDSKHLIVGLYCPELSKENERLIVRANLKAYELCVNEFGVSDYIFDQKEIVEPRQRTIGALNVLRDNSAPANGKCPLIVAYLEFI